MTKEIPNELDDIWSVEYWERKAEVIEMNYWGFIKSVISKGSFPKTRLSDPDHRIEEFVRKLGRKMENQNLHLGLTSSDLEDNIRTMRCEDSMSSIIIRLRINIIKLNGLVERDNKTITAFTHLKPAGKIDLVHRFAPTLELLGLYCLQPELICRGIKGSLGNKRMQKVLGVSDDNLREILSYHREQEHSHQAANHSADMESMVWILKVGAALAKLSGDIRMMFALGQARYSNAGTAIGSTAIAHKAPNPWRWERISGMMTSLIGLPGVAALAIADCHLERTLTDQSVLNSELERGFRTLQGMIVDMHNGLDGLHFTDDGLTVPDSEMEVLDLILNNKSVGRLEAYYLINKKYNK